MIRTLLLLALTGAVMSPAYAGWRTTTPQAEESSKIPRIAAALAATERFDQAILSKDQAAFASFFTEDAVVNNPFNKIARKQDAINNMKTGLINYTSLDRSLEYAAVRPCSRAEGSTKSSSWERRCLPRWGRRGSRTSECAAARPKYGPTQRAHGSYRYVKPQSTRQND